MHIAPLFAALALALGLGTAHAQFAGGTPPSGGTAPTGTVPTGTAPGNGTTASGTLSNSSVTIGYHYNDLATALASSVVTVGSGVEVACPDSAITLCASSNSAGAGLLDGESLDLDATSITGQFLAAFTAAAGDSFNGLVFSGLDFGTGYALTGITLSTNIAGLDLSDISFTADALTMNWLGIDPSLTTDGSSLGTFTVNLQVSAVPEPTSAALMLLGLAALASVRARPARRHAR